MNTLPSLADALMALLLDQGQALTAADVIAVLANPSSQAERIEVLRHQMATELADGTAQALLTAGDVLSAPAEQDAATFADDWQALAAVMYQTAGAYDLPERVLDLLGAAQQGEPFAHLLDTILPVATPEHLQDEVVVQVIDELEHAIALERLEGEDVNTRNLDALRMARAFIAQAAGQTANPVVRGALAKGSWRQFCSSCLAYLRAHYSQPGSTVWLSRDDATQPWRVVPPPAGLVPPEEA